ncbi:M48 family metalloprotease [Pedobacter aquae]|uniref:M48 family metalloprotease n=1 Tax=Pedobacter aquae TaxID=2605747 RepID=A0A5C0VJ84_9SPHI|nr:M48 family metalloprotease [Pedobacter aquae]QEK52765.1 M48 family metalloprotease [Pedobacter aquae]
MINTFKKFLYLISFTILLLINACSENPVTGRKQLVLMSTEQEIALGQETDPQIIAQYGLYEDKNLQEFITTKGNEMAAISHRPELKYEFKIVDSDIINAFAVPGGYVYFTRGIMAHFNNEAEFAGVLGHEIGHIAARHSVEQQRNAILGQLGLLAGMIIAPDLAKFGHEASQGLDLLFLKFGRDAERESDELGVEYASKIGYDAKEMASFFKTLERKSSKENQMLPDFLSTHPNPGDRYVVVGELAEAWKEKLATNQFKINRNSYLKKIDGLIYGPDPRQGFQEGNIFYHPVLKFQFPTPAKWNVQNTPQMVQMAPEDGGALLSMQLAEEKVLQTAADNFIDKNQLNVVTTSETTINSLPAITVSGKQQQENQEEIQILSYFFQYQNQIYVITGIASAANFNNYKSAFIHTMTGFKPLSHPDKLNKQAERIRIKTVSQNVNLQQALKAFKVAANRLEEHAILNGMELTDKVEKGMLIKVVE